MLAMESGTSTAGAYAQVNCGENLCRMLEKGPNPGQNPKMSVVSVTPTLKRVGTVTKLRPVLSERNRAPSTDTLGRSVVEPTSPSR